MLLTNLIVIAGWLVMWGRQRWRAYRATKLWREYPCNTPQPRGTTLPSVPHRG